MSSVALEAAPPRAARRHRLRSSLFAIGALALAAAGIVYGRAWWNAGRFVETTDDAYVGGDVTSIAPHVDGFIAAVLVADNSHVHAGQVLIRIDPRDAEAALAHDQAALMAQLAARDGLRAQVELQQATIRQGEEELAARVAHAAFAVQDARRYANLAATPAGTRQNEQRTASLEQEARSDAASALAGLQAARQQLKVLQARIAEADARVAGARADIATARLDLGYTDLTAPVDGVVGNRAAEVGTYVKAGTYLISVIPSRGLWVDANFKEDQLTRMSPGQPADVVADVLPGHVFHARVASLTPGTGAVFSIIPPENATGNFTKIVQRVPVRVVLDGDDAMLPALRPGLSTTVSVDTKGAPR